MLINGQPFACDTASFHCQHVKLHVVFVIGAKVEQLRSPTGCMHTVRDYAMKGERSFTFGHPST
jgi:hypothetical protein